MSSDTFRTLWERRVADAVRSVNTEISVSYDVGVCLQFSVKSKIDISLYIHMSIHVISYFYIMARRPISITLDADNVLWLKRRAGIVGESVSEVVDQLVTAARQGAPAGEARSIVGTIDIDSSDPRLERADAAVQAVFEASLGRPLRKPRG